LDAFGMNNSPNGKEPTGTPRIRKLDSGVKKLRGSDIDWLNPYGNQATHFVSFTKSLNVPNSSNNHKKTNNTFEVGLIMCISSTNKGKT
jgi:hypothetical protein